MVLIMPCIPAEQQCAENTNSMCKKQRKEWFLDFPKNTFLKQILEHCVAKRPLHRKSSTIYLA